MVGIDAAATAALLSVPYSDPSQLTSSLEAVSTEELRTALEICSVPSRSPLAVFSNWARTFECRPQRVFSPTTPFQCRQIVELARREGATVHPVGVGHSPSDLGCTNGWLVRMEGVQGTLDISHTDRTATFQSGTTLHAVHEALAAAQPALALRNIGSISDQTIGGLISTATHGSGVTYPVISADVRSLVMVLPLPGAPVVCVSREADYHLFAASQCGLGSTGLILAVEIMVEDAYRLEEVKDVYGVDEVIDNLDEISVSAQHVRAWWYPSAEGMVVARANRTYVPAKPQSSLVGHILGYHVTQFLLFVSRYWRNFTPYVGKWAWWLAGRHSVTIDDGYKVLNFDCLFPQYTSEWALDSAAAADCLRALRDYIAEEAANPNGQRVHFPVEIRWSAPDDIPLSPSYGRRTCWVGVVTYRPYGLPVPYRVFQTRFAQICAAHGGRPHWAKEHWLAPKDVEEIYERFPEFRAVIQRVDPQGVLRSEYVRRHILGEDLPLRMFKRRP
ncbi:hypothetical protein CspeluHIS016_0105940 [Cutaneotrichosporon spelunceum]|uniref:D-arabinono-1,4-lactone oxidase n=1 Tax=Cutaneotrichosporon spelunceum TaxID=1672016 RepID=A0AAD3Y9H9_9TREE|nr:hypothetical protein CspeluHIS016_0105940 [Cutaneotrichosporon spelunceum]